MEKTRWRVLLVTLGLMSAAALAWGAEKPLTVAGTITALTEPTNAEASAWYVGELRVDPAAGPGRTEKIRWQRSQVGERGKLCLGDQVRLTLGPVKDGLRTAEGQVTYLGRGDFISPGAEPALDLGSPKAKVLVKMLAPLQSDCHRKTADLLQGIAAREPDRVRLQIFDMSQPGARVEMGRERLTCATVLVNNRYEFTVKDKTGERRVQLWHRPNDPNSTYKSEDAAAVVEQEIARLYPPAQATPPAAKSTPPASPKQKG